MAAEVVRHLEPPDRETLSRFAELRKRVYDTQIQPSLHARAAWLRHEQPTDQENIAPSSIVPTTEGLVPQQLGAVLLVLDRGLSDIIGRAEREHTFGAYVMQVYEERYGSNDPERNFNIPYSFRNANRDIDDAHYDKAVGILFQTLQRDVPLKPTPTWQEAVVMLEEAGKRAPEPPEEIIYSGGPDEDGGPLNSRLTILLPTKAPHLFVYYNFRALGKIGGVAQVSEFPRSVGVKATTLDRHYPQYPFQRQKN